MLLYSAPVVKEVNCRTIISKSGIYGIDYAINPYIGCQHACVYCYARFMCRFVNYSADKWGSFIYVKRNAARIIRRDLRRAKKGAVLISSVTDPYQPIESKYQLTRALLEELVNSKFSISILTKSQLILRDLDIIKQLPDCEVGLTITTLKKDVQKVFEPYAPDPYTRLRALSKLTDSKIKTYVFLGPLLPGVIDDELPEIFKELAGIGISRVIVDKLNIKCGNWKTIKKALESFPEENKRFEKLCFDYHYFQRLKKKIANLSGRFHIYCEFCY